MVDPNNIQLTTKDTIDVRQKILGFVKSDKDSVRFILGVSQIPGNITSSYTEYSEHLRKYYNDFYSDMISLAHVLRDAGAIITSDPEVECDISLAPENLEKDTILNLLR